MSSTASQVQSSDDSTSAGLGDDLREAFAEKIGSVEIQAFVIDESTADMIEGVFQELSANGGVARGGVTAAIKHLGESDSPPMLIVDLSDSDSPMGDIDALAERCEAGTNVIALGTANDVALFRELIGAGVADYLVKPIRADTMAEAIVNATARPDLQPAEKKAAGLIVFVGARGGVGASMLAVNTAWLRAHEMGQRVALVDLDLQFGTAALALDLDAGRGLSEALMNPARIDGLFIASAAVKESENLYVLCAEDPLEDHQSYSTEALEALLDELCQNFDTVVIDMPRAAAVERWKALSGAEQLFIVTDYSLSGMRDTGRLVELAKSSLQDVKISVVVNRAGNERKSELPKREFERGFEGSIEYIIPEDTKAVTLSAQSGKALGNVAKKSKVTVALRKLCADAPDVAVEEKKAHGWRRMVKK